MALLNFAVYSKRCHTPETLLDNQRMLKTVAYVLESRCQKRCSCLSEDLFGGLMRLSIEDYVA